MTTAPAPVGVISIGRKALIATRRALLQDLGERGMERLQEIGCAAGEEVYESFSRWLPEFAGVRSADELDASALEEVLSEFFTSIGWGGVAIERLGTNGLSISSSDWAEADPSEGSEYPSCYFSSGLFADFLTRMAGGNAISIMEVECRSRGDDRCRFFAGAPSTLDAVYNAIAEGRDYREIFEGASA
ncbi:MAG: V4R domain-containing protein [Vicinamibacteria bacterium]